MGTKTVTLTDEEWVLLLDILTDNDYLNDLDKKYSLPAGELYQKIGKQVIRAERRERKT